MDGNIQQQHLITAVRETFEHLAFMEPVYLNSRNLPKTSKTLWFCEMKIVRPVHGLFHLGIERDGLVKAASAIWGKPVDALGTSILTDTFGELLNTIGGKYMQLILFDGQSFQLGLPTVMKNEEAFSDHRWGLLFDLEGYNFQISLSGEQLLSLGKSK